MDKVSTGVKYSQVHITHGITTGFDRRSWLETHGLQSRDGEKTSSAKLSKRMNLNGIVQAI